MRSDAAMAMEIAFCLLVIGAFAFGAGFFTHYLVSHAN